MKSLLSQPTNPFPNTTLCQAGRQEQTFALYQNGFRYTFTVRDKLAVEDPFLVLSKAVGFAIKHATPYPGGAPPRKVRDFLIKNTVVSA
jgi:hypothetical protein